MPLAQAAPVPQHQRPATAARRLRRLAPRQSSEAASRPQRAASRDGFHLGLGIALIVGGVVAGLLLGGWLGLGVGALVVLGGYYFLILGIGGPDAWLEVGQEFFNM